MVRTVVVAFVAAVLLAGCTKSKTGGGAGDDTFTVILPSATVDVKQGETQLIKLSVKRGASFKQDVGLELKAPDGLDIEPDSTTVKPEDKGEVQLTVTAAGDAALGDQTIMLLAKPERGAPVEMQLKVKVLAK